MTSLAVAAARPPAAPAAASVSAPVDVTEYGARRVLIVVGVMLAALLQTLDATIVNVALPTIEGNIGASIDEGTWIITGYIISNVVMIPLAPYLLRRLGRKQYFTTCIVGFTVASFLCGTSGSLEVLILWRVVQGIFGGGLIATSQIILRDTFPAKMIGASSALFAIALTVGPALGPTVGGILTDQLSWPWVFDINIVPGAIAAFVMATQLKNPERPQRLPFDAVGVALLAATLASFQYVLDEGERHDWFDDPLITAMAAGSVVFLAAFVTWELHGTRHPIVDLRVFRHANVRTGSLLALTLGMVVFGPTVILPQYVQGILGFTATLSGLLIFLRAAPVLLLTPFVARAAGRIDGRILLVTGFVTSAYSFYLLAMAMTSGSDFGSFALPLVVSGIGQSLLLVPLLVTVLGSVPPSEAPKASSFTALSVQLGGSIASTLLVTVLDRRTSFHSDIDRGFASLHYHGVAAFATRPGGLAGMGRLLQQQATNAGFADTLFTLGLAALVATLPVPFLRRGAKPNGPTVVAE